MEAESKPQQLKIELQVLLVEYRALRNEMLQLQQNRNGALIFGSATLLVVFTAGLFAIEAFPIIAYFVFAFIIPFASIFVLIIWFSSLDYSYKIGRHLARIENKINKIFGKNTPGQELLEWENILREKCIEEQQVIFDLNRIRYGSSFQWLLMFFSGLAFISLAIALIFTNVNIILKLIAFIGVPTAIGYILQLLDNKLSLGLEASLITLINIENWQIKLANVLWLGIQIGVNFIRFILALPKKVIDLNKANLPPVKKE